MVGTSRRATVAAALGIALGSAACSPGTVDREQQACTWTIGVMGALEGDYAELGEPPARGVQVAVELANESGELACALETHSEDTGGDPEEAPVKARRLVRDEGLIACVCGYFTSEVSAAGDVFERGGVAMLSTSEESKLRRQGFDTWFRLVTPADRQAQATARYIRRKMAPRRVVVLTDYLPYSNEVADRVAEGLGWRFKGPIVRLVTEENWPDVAVKTLRRMSPDLVFFAGFAPQAWEMLHYMRESGLKMPFVTDGGAMHEPYGRYDEADRALLSCACSDATRFEKAAAFVAEYRARYEVDPDRFAADAFDGANLVIDALRELDGSEPPEDVRAHVVAHLDAAQGAEGIVKDYTWDDRGELLTDDGDVWMWEWSKRSGFRMLDNVTDLAT